MLQLPPSPTHLPYATLFQPGYPPWFEFHRDLDGEPAASALEVTSSWEMFTRMDNQTCLMRYFYMVDMAKADALDVLDENRQALVLVDRHD